MHPARSETYRERDKRDTDNGHSATDLVHDPPFINGHSVREAEARVHDDAAALVVCARSSLAHLAYTCMRRTCSPRHWC